MAIDPIAKTTYKKTGRNTVLKGVVHGAGLVIRPEQMIHLFRDRERNMPIPDDAVFKGLEIDDKGADSVIRFYYESIAAPLNHCFELNPNVFLKYLLAYSDGMLPLDCALDGIEISDKFTIIMLRIKSSHFPPNPKDDMFMYHLRYEGGELTLHDPFVAIQQDIKRIKLTDTPSLTE